MKFKSQGIVRTDFTGSNVRGAIQLGASFPCRRCPENVTCANDVPTNQPSTNVAISAQESALDLNNVSNEKFFFGRLQWRPCRSSLVKIKEP